MEYQVDHQFGLPFGSRRKPPLHFRNQRIDVERMPSSLLHLLLMHGKYLAGYPKIICIYKYIYTKDRVTLQYQNIMIYYGTFSCVWQT